MSTREKFEAELLGADGKPLPKKSYTVVDKREETSVKDDTPELPKHVQKPIPKAPDYDKLGVKMMGKRFLFQDFPHAEKMGSLFMPNMGDMGINKARVVAIGTEVTTLKVGDIVFKVAELGETLLTSLGTFKFLPETAVIAVDTDFTGEPMPFQKDDNSEL